MFTAIGWLILWCVLGGGAYCLTDHYASRLGKRMTELLWIVSTAATALWLVFFLLYYTSALWVEWLLELRAARGVELIIVFVGVWCALVQRRSIRRMPPKDRFSRHNGLVLVIMLAIPMHAQPVVFPHNVLLNEEWKDGVCLQSTDYTCGPASVATILHHYGIDASEGTVCDDIGISRFGTTEWEMVRFFRKKGLEARILTWRGPPFDPPVPCVAAVILPQMETNPETGEQTIEPGIPHFITLLEKTDTTFVIGDPLGGRFEWTKEMTWENYFWNHVVIHVTEGG